MDAREEVLRRDAERVWHPYSPTPHWGPKTVFTRASGSYVFDCDDRGVLDLTASWWCNTHGHCHPRLVRALRGQAGTLDQVMFSPHTHPVAVDLAERICAHLGAPFTKVFFSDDGSTAVEAALKMAVQYWHNRGETTRHRFVSLQGGYHGDTLGAVGVSHIAEFHHYFQRAQTPALSLEVPRDEASVAEALAAAEARLAPVAGEIAAVIVEPLVMGAAGMVIYPASFLDGLVAMAHRLDIPIIFDEVFTGFGRTGKMFALDHLKERPDFVCLSKGLTGGMIPLAATVVTDAIFDAFRGGPRQTFYHGHTFTANAIGCAVALESLKIFEEERVVERNAEVAALFREQVTRFSSHPAVENARALGMIWAVDLKSDPTRADDIPTVTPAWRVAEQLWEKGFWIRPLGRVLYTVPPYCTTVTELREFFERLSDAI